MNIKKELQKEYDIYVEKNSKDSYSKACIDAGEKVMNALDEGKTPQEAESAMDSLGITGFMAGCVAKAVSHFHERGEEFKHYWNKQFGVDDSTSVVNPAVITIKDKNE